MLTIKGPLIDSADGITRRSFMKVGGLSLGGLSLPQLLQAEAKYQSPLRPKSVIMVFLPGGPWHILISSISRRRHHPTYAANFSHCNECPRDRVFRTIASDGTVS